MTMHSATLAINEAITRRRARGERVLHLGFGEAGLPVLPVLREALAAAARHNSYGPVVGSEAARTAAGGWFTRRGLVTTADQVVFGPGSKALLFAAMAVLPGDVVLPTPSWVSYAAQATIVGKHVIGVPIPGSAGGIPDPDRLEAALDEALKSGRKPGVLILTVPDNPTGTVATLDQLRRISEIVDRHGLAVVSDEIYASVVHDGQQPPSITAFLDDHVLVTTGLSKSLALGGWRIGYARIPDTAWGRALSSRIVGVASEIWSSLAAPQQEAANFILDDPDEVLQHIQNSARLHATVSRAVHAEFVRVGCLTRPPAAGFYLYPDFEPLRPALNRHGIDSGTQLAEVLLNRHSVGVLPGRAFGDQDRRLRVRVATSLLYGTSDEERWAALKASDPLELGWLAESLRDLRTALEGLLSSATASLGGRSATRP